MPLMTIFDETRGYHAQLDGCLVQPLLAGDLTIDRYRESLIRIYGFEAPLESALAYTRGFTALCDLRPRSGLLVRDLLTLGMRPAQIAGLAQHAISPFANPATALGWFYVYERMHLLHPIVCARVERLAPGASEFFCRDAVAVSERWDHCAGLIEVHARTAAARRAICDGAIDAFEEAIGWFRGEAIRMAQ